jgi:hypothetical protein
VWVCIEFNRLEMNELFAIIVGAMLVVKMSGKHGNDDIMHLFR